MRKLYCLIESTFTHNKDKLIFTEVRLSSDIDELEEYLHEIYEEALESPVDLINGVNISDCDDVPPEFNRRLSFCYEQDWHGGHYVEYEIVPAEEWKKRTEISTS